MAKKRGKSNGSINVSEAIRTAWDADRSAKPVAIVEQLAGQGIKTNTGLVSSILTQYRKKLGVKGRRRRRKAVGTEVVNAPRDTTAAASTSVSSVIEAYHLVSKAKDLVGADGLRQIVKAL